MKYALFVAGVTAAAIFGSPPLQAHSFHVTPYLQTASANSMWISWETSGGDESIVLWGITPELDQQTSGQSKTGNLLSRLHEVQLTGLKADTIYYYRVKTGDALSDVFSFRTPPLPTQEKSSRILAMSDMQQDLANPNKFRDVINNGVIPYVENALGMSLHDGINMTLIPGDLVDNGNHYDSWRNTFFGPIAPLARHVPTYPAPGNHENDTDYFFNYFNLPKNGSPNYLEHWWYQDQSNIRVVSLDTNTAYRIDEQLQWLDTVLMQTCTNSDIDFVFAQMHHPHKSEMWLAGETDYSGKIVSRLEQFSSACNKPSIHFFGHTHAYSRGTSRDHKHAMVNVASAGGNLDYFGEYAQADYTEFAVSQDEYGFVMVDVQAGDDPYFEIKRISLGDENTPLNNVQRDSLKVKLNNTSPYTPEVLWPHTGDISSSCNLATATLFADADLDLFGAAHWQVSTQCNDFSTPVFDHWYQHQNIWNEQDTRANKAPNRALLKNLQANQNYCVRVRMRDRALAWSQWSTPVAFATTGAVPLSDNLLSNAGAEHGVEHWQGSGPIESLSSGQCDAVSAHNGSHLFAIGGVCANEQGYGSAFQRVDVTDYAPLIEQGGLKTHLSGYMRNFNGSDIPTIHIEFKDAQLNTLAKSDTLSGANSTWKMFANSAVIPPQTRYIDFVLTGTRKGGTDNDSYFDSLSLKVETQAASCPIISDKGPTGAPVEHITQDQTTTTNLLQNPDAEAGISGWSGNGPIEALTDKQCGSVPPFEGQKFFAVGGVCQGETAFTSVSQRVSVQNIAHISDGNVTINFGGMLRNYSGNDTPAIKLSLFDVSGALISNSDNLTHQSAQWQGVSGQLTLPANTAFIDFVLTGKRNHGTDNDSYFDALYLTIAK
ncbi:metallophosphoesterase family protein [Pseudoalteromonas sp. JBTF-M23]|uniref:Metallophosphoesterase family protein n=1 Tax=Pseudoalteromonas caenipelagi TaxID=2726988 RepID=A0A849VAS1_9GAMM|nr:metallophosphoesterase family protein [Pseudoalteromonas caenipelagi]NOU49870.1 metallophosphoesterase family protein [Pseudoalteromonas caenipelagi]